MPYNDIMKRPVILVASPLARLRRRWHQALKLEFTIRQAGNPAALEQSMANLKPAILLLDLALLGNGEVAGVRSIQRLSRLTKIVLFTRTRKKLHFSIERYFVNQLREAYDFYATPIRVIQRTRPRIRRRSS